MVHAFDGDFTVVKAVGVQINVRAWGAAAKQVDEPTGDVVVRATSAGLHPKTAGLGLMSEGVSPPLDVLLAAAEGEESERALDALAGGYMAHTGDLARGVAAFRDKRKADFQGD